MKNYNWTPSPWTYKPDKYNEGYWTVSGPGWSSFASVVTEMEDGNSSIEGVANVKLISKAPELVEHLESMTDMWRSVCMTNGWDPHHMEQYTESVKLLRKLRKG